jgi:hypothetical protein
MCTAIIDIITTLSYRNIGFLGGIDPCFGRWDTTEHGLSDVEGIM